MENNKVASKYTVEGPMGRWGMFTLRKDAEASAKLQREADRKAGKIGRIKVVRVSA